MLSISGEQYRPFIDWLNKHYPSNFHVQFVYLAGQDSVIGVVGEPAVGTDLACYLPHEYVIYVADFEAVIDVTGDPTGEALEPDEDLLTIARAYAHHLQHVAGKPFNDEEADRLATKMVEEYRRNQAD